MQPGAGAFRRLLCRFQDRPGPGEESEPHREEGENEGNAHVWLPDPHGPTPWCW